MGMYDGLPLEVPSGKPWREAYAELKAEKDALVLQIACLKNALYAECRGISCDRKECYGGYRSCAGCEERAKAAFGPGWQSFVFKRPHEVGVFCLEHRRVMTDGVCPKCCTCPKLKPEDHLHGCPVRE